MRNDRTTQWIQLSTRLEFITDQLEDLGCTPEQIARHMYQLVKQTKMERRQARQPRREDEHTRKTAAPHR
jgi:hypothetical protein